MLATAVKETFHPISCLMTALFNFVAGVLIEYSPLRCHHAQEPSNSSMA